MVGSACYVQTKTGLSGASAVLPIAPLMLFLAATESDEPDTAARDAAIDLGRRLERPVLLLDLAARPDGQYEHFAALRALLPRPALAAPPDGHVALHFHALRDSSLWVSTLSPRQVAPDEAFWSRQVEIWPTTRRRLLELFGAVVIAAPSLARSGRGMALAARVEATVLALRDGPDVGRRGEQLAHQVAAGGGRSVGVVLTGCDPHTMASHLLRRSR